MSGYKESSYQVTGNPMYIQAINNRAHVRTIKQDINYLLMRYQQVLSNQKMLVHQVNDWIKETSSRSVEASLYPNDNNLDSINNELTKIVNDGEAIRRNLQEGILKILNSYLSEIRKKWVKDSKRLGGYIEESIKEKINNNIDIVVRNANQLENLEDKIKSIESEIEDVIRSAEKKEQIKLNADIKYFKNEIENIKIAYGRLLRQLSPGLRNILSEEINQGETWLKNKSYIDNEISELSKKSEYEKIKHSRERIENLFSRGEALIGSMQNKIKESEMIKETAIKEISILDAVISENRELISKWLGNDEKERLQNKLSEEKYKIEQYNLGNLNSRMADIKNEIEAKIKMALEIKEKDVKRNYVLDALKKVCKSLAFRIEHEPCLEKKEDPKSRIILMVDTHNRGKIRFYLSLESISVNSQVSDEFCIEEFKNLSDQLKTYGVITDFKKIAGEISKPPTYEENKEEPIKKTKSKGA